MKQLILLFSICTVLSCSQESKEHKQNPQSFPNELNKIFNTHGGFTNWQAQRTLSFDIVTEEQRESQTIDLHNRREYIAGSNFTMGYDGSQTWIKADSTYKGNPLFYKNLMFYFYAMPFVLGDPGINYSETTPLSYDGKEYPGLRISYNDGVGASSKDEYFIHYNPDTYQMQWLGYTVTFRSGEKSESVKWIEYSKWKNVDGILLPLELTWYNVENNRPLSPRSARSFENTTLSKKAKPNEFYAIIAGAQNVE